MHDKTDWMKSKTFSYLDSHVENGEWKQRHIFLCNYVTECATCTPDAMRKKASPIVAILQNRRTDKPWRKFTNSQIQQ